VKRANENEEEQIEIQKKFGENLKKIEKITEIDNYLDTNK